MSHPPDVRFWPTLKRHVCISSEGGLNVSTTVRYSPSIPRQVIAHHGTLNDLWPQQDTCGTKTNDEPNLSPLAKRAHHVHTSIPVHLWHTRQPG